MIVRNEKAEAIGEARVSRRRLWRYGPLFLWMVVIFLASTGELSASNTSRILRPLLLWVFPSISEEAINFAHFIVRKAAHFTEYAVLALLAVRAFVSSSHEVLRRRWFLITFLLVMVYSLADELHQSFIASRTGTIYDSFIDMAGGFTALLVYRLWRARKTRGDIE